MRVTSDNPKRVQFFYKLSSRVCLIIPFLINPVKQEFFGQVVIKCSNPKQCKIIS